MNQDNLFKKDHKHIPRPRRLRQNESIRHMLQETHLLPQQLIYPIFIQEGTKKTSINSMPGQYRWPVSQLPNLIKELFNHGILSVALFPVINPNKKCPQGKCAFDKDNILFAAIDCIKSTEASIQIVADIALDPYSSDGHDGLVENGVILNDATVDILAKMAVCFANRGADILAPSDMMDGRIAAIRSALNNASLNDKIILSYTAKYASSFYGPFRDALDSAPKAGDKKTYQMDPSNRNEAIKEMALDLSEDTDIVMVKPALPYLDIISDFKKHTSLPVAAYQVSGEYASLKAAIQNNWLSEQVLEESLLSIKRAGADLILSYGALEWAKQK